jgi:hypothetical protein
LDKLTVLFDGLEAVDGYAPIEVNVMPKSARLVATKNGTYFPNIDGGCSDTLSWDGNTEGL